MKTIIKEETIVKKYNVYESIDGKTFKSEEECKKWEESYKCVINASFKKLNPLMVSGVELGIPWANEDNRYYLVALKSVDDVVTLDAWLKANYYDVNDANLSNEYVGKTIIVEGQYDNDYCYIYDFEKMIANQRKYYEKCLEEMKGNNPN